MIARRPPRNNNPLKFISRVFLLAVVIISIALHSAGSFAVADYAYNYNRIHYGVKIFNADVSGLTIKEGQAKLKTRVEKAAKESLTIKNGKQEWQVEQVFLKTKPDLAKTMSNAYRVSRTGSAAKQLLNRFVLYFRPDVLAVASTVNDEFAVITANKVGAAIDKPARDATVVIESEKAVLVTAKDGWEVKRGELKALIIRRAADFSSRVIVPPEGVAKVHVHNDDAEKARIVAQRMIKEPVKYSINNKSYEMVPAKIGSLIGFTPIAKKTRKNGKTTVEYTLKAALARDKLEQYFIPLKDEFETKPIDARFEAAEGAVTIIPGSNGLVIDMDAAVSDLNKLVLSAPPRSAVLIMKEVEPAITTAKAEGMGIKERVSVHTENFEFTVNRSKNISLLADAIDGMLVAPGQIWSINAATGPRTAGMGYAEAPVIVNGQLSPDIGGGICNVSTTVFNTAFFGGYEIVERYPHDFYISHYPDGRDASIYYDGGMDFKFKNDTPFYVLIKTDHTESSVTVAFYSTKTDVDVSYTDTGFTNIVPYGIVYKDDATLPAGWEKDGDLGYGVDGRDITVTRVVKKGGQVTAENKFASHYEPKQRIVLKGTGAALPPGAPPPAGLRPLGQTPR